MSITFGSVCSGIEAASVAFNPLGWSAEWFSEIDKFPCELLKYHYPQVPNIGDMTTLPSKILSKEIDAPQILCGGTPCQAFSMAGKRLSLQDDRGNLSLTFCEIADAIDTIRLGEGRSPAIILWENVAGVLNTKDNAFGCFLGKLSGSDVPLKTETGRWSHSGVVIGKKRTIAWRLLDAQYFGTPQRRRRVFVLASARKDFSPYRVLFETASVGRNCCESEASSSRDTSPASISNTEIDTHLFRIRGFGDYVEDTASATLRAFGGDQGGGSESILIQNGAIRKLTPLECERLQGFPDNYTRIPYNGKSQEECPNSKRYKAIGNSWAVPCARWIGERVKREIEK